MRAARRKEVLEKALAEKEQAERDALEEAERDRRDKQSQLRANTERRLAAERVRLKIADDRAREAATKVKKG